MQTQSLILVAVLSVTKISSVLVFCTPHPLRNFTHACARCVSMWRQRSFSRHVVC